MKQGISTIFWCASIVGIVYALAPYLGALAPKNEFMRSIYFDDVRHDTVPAICRRLLIGVTGGAIIGMLLSIRDRKSN